MRVLRLVLVLLAASSCSGSSGDAIPCHSTADCPIEYDSCFAGYCAGRADAGAGHCVARAGMYMATFAFPDAGTTCTGVVGPIAIQGSAYGNGTGATCVFGPTTGDDALCETTIDLHCTESGDTCSENGSFTWSTDGTSGHGSVTTTCVDPGGTTTCSGTYGVTVAHGP